MTDAERSSAAASTDDAARGTGPRVFAWGIAIAALASGGWAFADRLMETVETWQSNDDYGHGFFVVPAALYFLWHDRERRPAFAKTPGWLGLILVALSGGMRYLAARFYYPELADLALVVWIAGACWLLAGWPMLRWSWRSIAFLVFMLPLPQGVELALRGPLQKVAAASATWVLQCLGQPAISEGVTILLDEHELEVERACSGLRMFFGVAALAFAQVVLTRSGWWRKLITIAAVVPVAVAANIIRLTVTGLLFQWTSGEFARKFSHDFAGWTMIPLAVVMFVGLSALVASLARRPPAQRTAAIGRLSALVVGLIVAVVLWHGFQGSRVAQALLSRAAMHEKAAEWGQAVEYFQRYLRLHPDEPDALLRLVAAFDAGAQGTRAKSRAAAAYRDTFQKLPDHPELALRAAELWLETGEYDQASATAAAASTFADADVVRRAGRIRALALGKSLSRSRDGDVQRAASAARDSLQKVLEQHPADHEVAAEIAVVWRRYLQEPEEPARIEEADRVLDALVERNPDHPDALLARYSYRMQFAPADGLDAERRKAIDADLDRALELGARDPALERLSVLFAAGQRARTARDLEAGRSYMKRAEALAPTDQRVYLAWGDLERALDAVAGDGRAVELWNAGMAQSGGLEVDFLWRLAEACIALGRNDEAEIHLRKLEDLRPLAEGRAALDWLELHLAMARALQDERANRRAQGAANLAAAIEAVQARTDPAVVAVRGQAWRLLARLSLGAGAIDLAADSLVLASKSQPGNLDLAWSAGEALAEAGRFGDALALFDETLPRFKPTGPQWLSYAEACLQEQQLIPPQARKWTKFETALKSATDGGADGIRAAELKAAALEISGQADQAIELLRGIAAAEPVGPAFRALAFAEQRRGDTAAALAAADRFDQVAKAPREGLTLRVRILEAAGRTDEAIRLLEAEANAESNDAQWKFALRLQVARLRRSSGDRAGALKGYLALLNQSNPSLALTAEAAELALADGQWETCEKLEESLIAIEGATGALWREIRARRALAQSSDADDPRFADAIRLQAELAALRPAWTATHLLRAQVARRMGDEVGAIEAYEDVERLGGRSLHVAEEMADLLYSQGRLAEAERYWQLDPAVLSQSSRMASVAIPIFTRKGEGDNALRLSEDWVQRRPDDAVSHVRLGSTLLRLSREGGADVAALQARAEAEFKKAVELAPADPRNWTVLFNFYRRYAGDQDAALETLKRLAEQIDIDPALRASVLAQHYEAIGLVDRAAASYRQSLQLAPDDARYLERAARFFAARDASFSEELCRKALASASGSWSARHTLIGLLAGKGTPESLAEAFSLLPQPRPGMSRRPADLRLEAMLLVRRNEKGDAERAIELLQSLLAEERGSTPSDKVALARLMERQGRLSLAFERFQSAVEDSLDPAYPLTPVATAFVEFLSRHADARQGGEAEGHPYFLDEANLQLDRLEARDDATVAALTLRLRTMADVAPDAIDSANAAAARIAALAKGMPPGETPRALPDAITLTVDDYVARRVANVEPPDARRTRLTQLFAQLARSGYAEHAVRLCRERADLAPAETLGNSLADALSVAAPVPSTVLEGAEPVFTAALSDMAAPLDLLLAIGNVRYLHERPEEAAGLYRRAIELDSRSVLAWNNLALALLDANQIPAAREAIDRAAELAPELPLVLDTQALVQLAANEASAAIATLEEVADQLSLDPHYWLHLATAQLAAKDKESAAKSYSRARAMNIDAMLLTPAERRALELLRREFAIPEVAQGGAP